MAPDALRRRQRANAGGAEKGLFFSSGVSHRRAENHRNFNTNAAAARGGLSVSTEPIITDPGILRESNAACDSIVEAAHEEK